MLAERGHHRTLGASLLPHVHTVVLVASVHECWRPRWSVLARMRQLAAGCTGRFSPALDADSWVAGSSPVGPKRTKHAGYAEVSSFSGV